MRFVRRAVRAKRKLAKVPWRRAEGGRGERVAGWMGAAIESLGWEIGGLGEVEWASRDVSCDFVAFVSI